MTPPPALFTGSGALRADACERMPFIWRAGRRASAKELLNIIAQAHYNGKRWRGYAICGQAYLATRLMGPMEAIEDETTEAWRARRKNRTRTIRRRTQDLVELGYLVVTRPDRGGRYRYALTPLAFELLGTAAAPPPLSGPGDKKSPTLGTKGSPRTREGFSGKDSSPSEKGASAPSQVEDKSSDNHEPKASQLDGSTIDQSERLQDSGSSTDAEVPGSADWTDLDRSASPPEEVQERANDQLDPKTSSESATSETESKPLPRDFDGIRWVLKAHYRDQHGIRERTKPKRDGTRTRPDGPGERFPDLLGKQARRVLEHSEGVDAGFTAECERIGRMLNNSRDPYPADSGCTVGWMQTRLFPKADDPPADPASITVPEDASPAEKLYLRHVASRGVFDEARPAITTKIDSALLEVRREAGRWECDGRAFLDRVDSVGFVSAAIERTWAVSQSVATQNGTQPAARFRYAMEAKANDSRRDNFAREVIEAKRLVASAFRRWRREIRAQSEGGSAA